MLSITSSLFAQDGDFDVAAPPTVTTTKEYTRDNEAQSKVESEAKSTKVVKAETVSEENDQTEAAESTPAADRLFGKATITERKRENGQVYAIEIQHSKGNKQYIEDNDSDGLTDGKTKDIDETPNIAKWRLGSW